MLTIVTRLLKEVYRETSPRLVRGVANCHFKANFQQRGHRPHEERKEAVPALVAFSVQRGSMHMRTKKKSSVARARLANGEDMR